jgi:zinc transporter, ZIP family
MAVSVALGAFLMTLAGGWTAQRVTDRRHLVRGLAGGLMLLAAPVAGAASPLLFTIPEQALGCYLGFFGGTLPYLAAAEILPEAHHEHPARSTLLATIAGAAFTWLVVGIAR